MVFAGNSKWDTAGNSHSHWLEGTSSWTEVRWTCSSPLHWCLVQRASGRPGTHLTPWRSRRFCSSAPLTKGSHDQKGGNTTLIRQEEAAEAHGCLGHSTRAMYPRSPLTESGLGGWVGCTRQLGPQSTSLPSLYLDTCPQGRALSHL